MKTKSKIAQFKSRIALCSMQDVVTTDGVMSLTRKDVFHAWAYIEVKKASQFSPGGYAISQSRDTQTHIMYMRYRRDFDISSAAWVYEERLKSAPRWYKILGVADDDEMWCLKCRLVERSDDVTPPVSEEFSAANVAMALPPGVKL